MLAYHEVMTNDFDGEFASIAPMSMGGRARLELSMRGKRKQSGRGRVKPAAAARKDAIKHGASESAADFWFGGNKEAGRG